jgi:hypothetical protein
VSESPQLKKKVDKNQIWEQKIALVLKGKLAGMSVNQMIAQFEIPERTIIRIMAEDEFKKGMKRVEAEVVRETLKDKLASLEEVASLSLSQIIETLKEIKENPEYKALMITGVRDLAALGKLATDMNTLLRLELGKSTQNVSTVSRNYQETRVVLQDLKKKDPVFEYPELPEK